ncbi:septum site-determining protein Ssd [Virgisporangium ochraceum]|uniref:Septum formation initiator n=1 Tax=Virgisporangium ochraceum TaxID=65505 RepID=A0A8J3ZQK7_9ACTN|nr:septum site-determining protein Ssd [Virgisporangium ochraceum]GIJ66480.1 septum formation initiator [Virgisporangium ochraceum]
MSADAPARSRPLLLTDDPHLLDEVLGLAGRAGADVEVAPDPAAARSRYGPAPLVLVGADLAEACVRARLPRRPGVIIVGFRSDDSDPPWQLAERLGAEHIALLPSGAPWLSDRLSGLVGGGSAGATVAVLGARGGAGATVLACGLAVTAVRLGLRALMVDGDPFGGGLDLVFGWEGVEGLRWSGLAHTAGAVGVPALERALPGEGALAVLSCDRTDGPAVPLDAMLAALEAGRRGWDLTVVDLPRRFDDASLAALAAADHALLVVPAELRACAAAARVATEALRHVGSMSLVVRRPAPGNLSPKDISRALGLPLAGTLRSEPAIARGLERGQPPAADGQGALADLCTRLVGHLGATRVAA